MLTWLCVSQRRSHASRTDRGHCHFIARQQCPSQLIRSYLLVHPCKIAHTLTIFLKKDQSISTYVEQLTARYVLDLLNIPRETFPAMTVVPGATSANVLGLALGREEAVKYVKGPSWSVANRGTGGVEVDVYCAGKCCPPLSLKTSR
jgi:glutamate/tyrosine decarboxylase-like PLP-dependent enzyme